jgi:hypothetical protein
LRLGSFGALPSAFTRYEAANIETVCRERPEL